MGQYWHPVNLDKREYIDPHKLACGLKLAEQLADNGVGSALVILCANMPEPRGGGDFDLDENWHGPERTDYTQVGPEPARIRGEAYATIAARTIGRWAGDRIALIGDYAKDGDLGGKSPFDESSIYYRCCDHEEEEGECRDDCDGPDWHFADVTNDVCAVIEHERRGKFVGDGWRRFEKGYPMTFRTQLARLERAMEREQELILRILATPHSDDTDLRLQCARARLRALEHDHQQLRGQQRTAS